MTDGRVLTLTSRQVAYLWVGYDDGTQGIGEVAPLPGFSKENLPEVSRLARDHAGNIIQGKVTDNLPASLQFGVCMAKTCRGSSPFEALVTDAGQVISSAVLCSLDQIPTLVADKRQPKKGVMKFKVARHEAKDPVGLLQEAKLIKDFSSLFPDIRLRLDANRGWTVDQAQRFLDQLGEANLEFIEEPCRTEEENLTLRKAGWPIAIDETLQVNQLSLEQTMRPYAAGKWHSLVIKPTLIGSVGRCRQLVAAAQSAGSNIVVSGSYESPLALGFLKRLAQEWSPGSVHGLDTESALAIQAADFTKRHLGELIWQR